MQSSNFATDGLWQATATRLEDATLATDAKFEGLTSESFTLEIIKQSGNRAGLAGLQIVEVPESSTLALLGIAAMGVLACAWQRCKFRKHRQGYRGASGAWVFSWDANLIGRARSSLSMPLLGQDYPGSLPKSG